MAPEPTRARAAGMPRQQGRAGGIADDTHQLLLGWVLRTVRHGRSEAASTGAPAAAVAAAAMSGQLAAAAAAAATMPAAANSGGTQCYGSAARSQLMGGREGRGHNFGSALGAVVAHLDCSASSKWDTQYAAKTQVWCTCCASRMAGACSFSAGTVHWPESTSRQSARWPTMGTPVARLYINAFTGFAHE